MFALSSVLSSILAFVLIFVPIDDRPATAQFPRLLAKIAGVDLREPPVALLGNYLNAGDPAALLSWLSATPTDTQAFVVSNDMIAYGGLVASRIPATSLAVAESRLAALASVRRHHSFAAFTVFGTVMRLAPTGVPALGPAADFPFAGSVWPKIQRYAGLPSPPQTEQQREEAARLSQELGSQLDSYLSTRARNLTLDLDVLRYTATGAFDRVVLGQDDAGPVGLAIPDLNKLFAYAGQVMPYGRWSIEPGTDELGMVYVAGAIVRQAGLVPKVRVIYSRPDGGTVQDPLEFAPIATTIDDVIRSSGGVQVSTDSPADVDLYVNVPNTSDEQEATFADSIAADPYRAAVADLSFIHAPNLTIQQRLMNYLIARHVAGLVESFASWNTTANTIGTAIPEAFVVLAGKRMNKYNESAHTTFTYMRYVDDVLFQKVVRPQLNADLTKEGVTDHTYLLPPVAARAAEENARLLRPLAEDLLEKIAPAHRVTKMDVTLPWNRTFEMQLNVQLTP